MIWPLFMITVYPGDPDDEGHAEKFAHAGDERRGQVALAHPTDQPITTENSRNEAVISGNHHHSVGSPIPRSSQGMTP